MAITYTEIKEQKNNRIWIFYTVVIVAYFVISILIASLAKAFFVPGPINSRLTHHHAILSALTLKETLYVLLFALLAAVMHIKYSASKVLSFVEQNLNAQHIDPTDMYHERFVSIVDELSVATGNKYRVNPVVVPTLAMNAFAICGHNRKAMIGVTEGLLSKLTKQQLEAVVAHEYGHIVSGDSFQTTIACSLFGIYTAMLYGMKKMFGKGGSGRGSGVGALVFIYIALIVTQFFYNIIRLFISRDRELRADAIAVQFSRDPISLSEALYAISRGWRGLGYIEPTLEALFIMNPIKADVDEESGFLANLFSTHPPISKRMAILAAMAHGSVDDVKANVFAQEKVRAMAKEVPKEAGLSWMAEDGSGKWSGPFSVSQMALLGWIKPDTQVKQAGEDGSKSAKDEPLLAPVFNGNAFEFGRSVLKCPKCSHFLVIESYEGFRLYHCIFCDGYLVDEKRLPRAIIRKEKGFEKRIEKLAELAQKDGLVKLGLHEEQRAATSSRCPKCGGLLVRAFYTMAYLVEIDRCLSCDVAWFDKDELEMVQYLIESK